jgi:hypothetical protein
VENERDWQEDRGRESTSSLLGFLAMLKKRKANPEFNATENHQRAEEDTIDQYKDNSKCKSLACTLFTANCLENKLITSFCI